MEVADVQKQIKQKNLNSIYIFIGEEIEVQRIYINKIIEVSDLPLIKAESVSSIYVKLTQKSFVSKDNIYLIYNDVEFATNANAYEKIVNLVGNNIIILVYSDIDKRCSLYKKHGNDIVDFKPLSDDLLIKYVQKNIDLSENNCKSLIKICESNYSRILLEIDKIKAYKQSLPYNIDVNSVFLDLLLDGTINRVMHDDIFELCNNISGGYIDNSIKLYNQYKSLNDNPMTLISVLYTNMKQMLQVQSCNSKDISKSTGLTGWQISQIQKRIGAYSNDELINAMRLLQKVESGIKSGLFESDWAMDYILVNIL